MTSAMIARRSAELRSAPASLTLYITLGWLVFRLAYEYIGANHHPKAHQANGKSSPSTVWWAYCAR